MAKDFGIEISKPGINVNNATPEQLVFSSNFKTLKINDRGSGTVNSSVGGGLATIPHGLGYTPVFMVHVDPGQLGEFYLAPYVPSGIFGTPVVYAYADSTNLYIKADDAVQNGSFGVNFDTNMWWENIGVNGFVVVGNLSNTAHDSAVRFDGVTVPQGTTLDFATVFLYKQSSAVAGSVLYTVFGIDEDNTADFTTNPMSRSNTTATHDASTSANLINQYVGFDVTNEMNEILARGGWSSGNAIAFKLLDNGTSTENARITDIFDGDPSTDAFLSTSYSTTTIANYRYTIFLNQLE